jgi:hypothetical protein
MRGRSSYRIKHVGIAIILGFSTIMSLAETPPAPATTKVIDPCKTEPCFKANDGQNASAPDLQRDPRDLTLQYPGQNLADISPKDAMNAAGRMADATQQLAEKTAGPIAGAAMEMAGKAAAVVTTTYDIADGAVTGYQNGGGAPGAAAAATKAGIAACAGAGAAVVVTALCAPVMGPAAPLAGVAADTIVQDATKDYLDHYQLPAPTDNSFACAKIGVCAESSPQAAQEPVRIDDAQAEIDSILANQTQKFDTQWTSAMSDRLDQLQAQLAEVQLQQQAQGTGSMSWISSAAALAVVAAGSKSQPALACVESIVAGAASSQCVAYAQEAANKQSAALPNKQQRALPFAQCYIYRGPKSNPAIPLCNACCTADGRETYVR